MGWKLNITDLYFGYDETLIYESLNLQLESGRVFALIGPNGSGKSTFIALLTGLLEPTRGRITLVEEGRELPLRLNVLASFQNPDKIFSQLKVRDELTYTLRLKDFPENEIEGRLAEVSDYFGWEEEFLEKELDTLSYGWKRIVGLAEYLILEGKLLCLDEPTANLHSAWSWKFWRYVSFILERREGFGFLFTTHKGEELLLSDEILLVRDRKMLRLSHRELVDLSERDDYLTSLLGITPSLSEVFYYWSEKKARLLRRELLRREF